MPEKQNIEWKSKWKDEYLEWICGFANAQGGKLYIGMNDEGEVVGLGNIRKLLEDIPNKIRQAMGIVVDVNRLDKGDLSYLEIIVPPYPVAISYKGTYYYRSGSQTRCKSIGIEYVERIYAGAAANQETAVSGRRTEFIRENAECYSVSADVDRCYFFNPFSVEILKGVLAKIITSYYENPRELQLFLLSVG